MSLPFKTRLGVNIDHVATLRRLRDTPYPNLLEAANLCIQGGADQITIHLREDRRHIVDADVKVIRENITVDLNLEMAATPEMLEIALQTLPHSICIVPEKREEKTTEGGLDLSNETRNLFLKEICKKAGEAGILVSFFIEATKKEVQKSFELGAKCVELHTGSLCLAHQQKNAGLFTKLSLEFEEAIAVGNALNMLVHAGHGIDYDLAKTYFSKISGVREYNIGHAIVCESVFCGITAATRKMAHALEAPVNFHPVYYQ